MKKEQLSALLDTSFFIRLLNKEDALHQRTQEFLKYYAGSKLCFEDFNDSYGGVLCQGENGRASITLSASSAIYR